MFPNEYKWALFVDLKKHNFDALKQEFESREPGYFPALMKAFDYALKHTDNKLTLDYIFRIHRLALESVEIFDSNVKRGAFNENGYMLYSVSPKHFTTKQGLHEWFYSNRRNFTSCFFIDGEAFLNRNDKDANRESFLIDTVEKLDDVFDWGTLEINNSDENVLDDIGKILQKYNNTLPHDSKEEALTAICTVIQKLERRHPFGDGNGRTFSMILLNTLLYKNGFGFALQGDPNRVDGLSLDQLLKEISFSIKKSELFSKKYDRDPETAVDFLRNIAALDRKVFNLPGNTPNQEVLNVIMRIIESGYGEKIFSALKDDNIDFEYALLFIFENGLRFDESIIIRLTEDSNLVKLLSLLKIKNVALNNEHLEQLIDFPDIVNILLSLQKNDIIIDGDGIAKLANKHLVRDLFSYSIEMRTYSGRYANELVHFIPNSIMLDLLNTDDTNAATTLLAIIDIRKALTEYLNGTPKVSIFKNPFTSNTKTDKLRGFISEIYHNIHNMKDISEIRELYSKLYSNIFLASKEELHDEIFNNKDNQLSLSLVLSKFTVKGASFISYDNMRQSIENDIEQERTSNKCVVQ